MTRPLNWKDFLQQADLPNDATCLSSNNTGHALVKVSGSDAENFLHAQFSNSVTGLESGEVRFAAWCNAKGRVWTLVRFWQDDDAIMLRMPTDQIEDTLKRLRMFVMRSDVLLEPLAWHATQFIGPDAEQQAKKATEKIEGITFSIPLPAAWSLNEVWSAAPINSELHKLPEELQALPRILAGIPEVFIDQREEWIPQMLNLDKLEGVDFKKGCYPGQEIVAKLHYKGGLKQRMFVTVCENIEQAITAKTDVLDANQKKVGTVHEAVQLGNHSILSVILRTEALGHELTVLNQPLTGNLQEI